MCLNVLSSTSVLMSHWIDDAVDAADAADALFLGCLSEKYGRNDIQVGVSDHSEVWKDPRNLVHSTALRVQFQIDALILRSWVAKLFFARWFYAVQSQSFSLFEVWQNPRNLAHSTILRVWVSGFNRHLDSLQYQCFYDCPMSKGIWCIHCIFCIRCIRFEGPWKLVWLLSLTAWSLKSRLPGWL